MIEMYAVINKHTKRVYAVFATYDSAIACYELERSDNLLVDMYEIDDNRIQIPMCEAQKIRKPTRESRDETKDYEKYNEIMGLTED